MLSMIFFGRRQTSEQVQHEAEHLCAMFDSQPHLLVNLLSGQLGVLKSQAQILMGLCGLAITVTGFSGAHMIRAGSWAALSMVLGIFLILVAIFFCLSILMQLRWVTQDLCDSVFTMAHQVLLRRNRQQQRLHLAGLFVAGGLTAYLLSVTIAALFPMNGFAGV